MNFALDLSQVTPFATTFIPRRIFSFKKSVREKIVTKCKTALKLIARAYVLNMSAYMLGLFQTSAADVGVEKKKSNDDTLFEGTIC